MNNTAIGEAVEPVVDAAGPVQVIPYLDLMYDQVLVDPIKAGERMVCGGKLYLPATARSKVPPCGNVVAVGMGYPAKEDPSTLTPLRIEEGNVIVYRGGGGYVEIDIDDHVFHLMREKDVVGIVREDKVRQPLVEATLGVY